MASIADFPLTLASFEGPLDLLLYLIRKNEVDLRDIPIAEITRQYTVHIHEMEELEMGVAGEYLVMASTLIYIKSRMLLPQAETPEGEAEDPRQELADQLSEYQKYKEISADFRRREERTLRLWVRPDAVVKRYDVMDIDEKVAEVWDLVTAFRELAEEKRRAAVRIEGEDYRIEDKMDELMLILAEHRTARLSELFDKAHSRLEKVVIFIALLELVRKKHLRTQQSSLFGDIHVYLSGSAESLAHAPSE